MPHRFSPVVKGRSLRSTEFLWRLELHVRAFLSTLSPSLPLIIRRVLTIPSPFLATATDTKFSVVNNIGTYLIYSLSGSLTLTASSTSSGSTAGTITASGPFNGVLRMVKLNDSSHEALLDQYYTNYATGMLTDYAFDTDGVSAQLRFTWTVQGDQDNLLLLTWPHHR